MRAIVSVWFPNSLTMNQRKADFLSPKCPFYKYFFYTEQHKNIVVRKHEKTLS